MPTDVLCRYDVSSGGKCQKFRLWMHSETGTNNTREKACGDDHEVGCNNVLNVFRKRIFIILTFYPHHEESSNSIVAHKSILGGPWNLETVHLGKEIFVISYEITACIFVM